MTKIPKIIATCFGIGYFPVAPGTFTSFAVVLLYKFFLYKLEWPYFLLLVLILFFSGVMISTRIAAELKSKDPRIIVVDEAAGQLLILFNMNPSWFNVLLAFFLFRFFDIIKPYPIKKVENFPRGWGIMMDDIVAAVFGGILINVYLLLR